MMRVLSRAELLRAERPPTRIRSILQPECTTAVAEMPLAVPMSMLLRCKADSDSCTSIKCKSVL